MGGCIVHNEHPVHVIITSVVVTPLISTRHQHSCPFSGTFVASRKKSHEETPSHSGETKAFALRSVQSLCGIYGGAEKGKRKPLLIGTRILGFQGASACSALRVRRNPAPHLEVSIPGGLARGGRGRQPASLGWVPTQVRLGIF